MADILEELSPEALANGIRANRYAFFRHLCTAPATEHVQSAHLLSWQTPFPLPSFNGVLSLEGAPEDAKHLIAARLAYFQEREVGIVTWWFEQGVDTAGWEPHLLQAGFEPDSGGPGMAVDLQKLHEAAAPPAGLEIVAVEDLAALYTWVVTGLAGFGLPADLEEGAFSLMAGMGLGPPTRYYLGYLEGEAVATSRLFLAGGVAGIYDVSTLPAVRGRGIGTAMTLAPLQDARTMGYCAAVLEATEMGFPVYRRIGFEEVCVMAHYSWRRAAG